MKLFLAICAALLSSLSHATSLNLNDFEFTNSSSLKLETSFVPRTLEWKRTEDILLLPHVLVRIHVPAANGNLQLEYRQLRLSPVRTKSGVLFELVVSLFEEPKLLLFENGEARGSLTITPKPGTGKVVLDHSCSPYEVKIETTKPEYLSAGCALKRLGSVGSETPLVTVKLVRASAPEEQIHFTRSAVSSTSDLNVHAKLPERLPRLRLALGLGPYFLESKLAAEKSRQLAPTVMLYGNLGLTDEHSLRFFDSYSKDVSTFHNGGLYYAWDLARFCDKRCQLTSLLGLQGIDYQYNSNSRTYSDVIFPQGFEFIYHHAFGQRNYKFSYGMFASLSQTYDYQNIWVRYGKGFFWELNYIEWGISDDRVRMYGLSVGFPLVSFF